PLVRAWRRRLRMRVGQGAGVGAAVSRLARLAHHAPIQVRPDALQRSRSAFRRGGSRRHASGARASRARPLRCGRRGADAREGGCPERLERHHGALCRERFEKRVTVWCHAAPRRRKGASVMSLKLHVFPVSPRAFKVLSVAAYLRLEHEVCVSDMTKGEHKSAAFTAMNPNQRMPVMDETGFVLWEWNAIMQHLAAKRPESGLLPSDPVKRGLVSQWQFW